MLGDNGGQTPTDALLAGSPAIGHALSSAPTCSSADQRGVNRLSSFCDPGAYQTIDADLALSGSGPSTVKAGQQIADTFTVSNGGPYAAGGVTFTATISSGRDFSLDAVTASQGCSSNVADVRRPHGDPELLARDADLGPDRRSADGHRYGQADAGPSGDLEQPGDRQRDLARPQRGKQLCHRDHGRHRHTAGEYRSAADHRQSRSGGDARRQRGHVAEQSDLV